MVDRPLLERCAPRKDFGRGFYLTTSLEQARSFALLSARKALANGLLDDGSPKGYVSAFCYRPDRSRPLSTFVFEDADADWLHRVVAHRKERLFDEVFSGMARYDIISGKITIYRAEAGQAPDDAAERR